MLCQWAPWLSCLLRWLLAVRSLTMWFSMLCMILFQVSTLKFDMDFCQCRYSVCLTTLRFNM